MKFLPEIIAVLVLGGLLLLTTLRDRLPVEPRGADYWIKTNSLTAFCFPWPEHDHGSVSASPDDHRGTLGEFEYSP